MDALRGAWCGPHHSHKRTLSLRAALLCAFLADKGHPATGRMRTKGGGVSAGATLLDTVALEAEASTLGASRVGRLLADDIGRLEATNPEGDGDRPAALAASFETLSCARAHTHTRTHTRARTQVLHLCRRCHLAPSCLRARTRTRTNTNLTLCAVGASRLRACYRRTRLVSCWRQKGQGTVSKV